jgi:hypothetical protein
MHAWNHGKPHLSPKGIAVMRIIYDAVYVTAFLIATEAIILWRL